MLFETYYNVYSIISIKISNFFWACVMGEMTHHEKAFLKNMIGVKILDDIVKIFLTRDGCHHRLNRNIFISNKRHASKDSPIFSFNIHAPFTCLDAVFRRIPTIAFFTSSCYRNRNAIRRHKGCVFIERSPLPMMIDGRLKRDGSKDRRETMDRSLNSYPII